MKILIILLFLAQFLFAEVDWFGYFEHENDYARLPEGYIYFGYNKLRMDFQSDISDNIRVGGNVISKFYHGKKQWNVMDYIHPDFYPIIHGFNDNGYMQMDTLRYFPYEMADTTFLDNAFIHIRRENFDITVGKQQVSPGVGYAWNPTDLFNNKDIMDPTYEQTGGNALRLSVTLNSKLTADAIVSPKDKWSTSKQQLQLKTQWGRFDASLIYGHSEFNKTKLMNSIISTRDLYGIAIEGEIAGIGVRSEFAINRVPLLSKDYYVEYILGADYTFESGLYVLSEYYHNDFGVNKREVDFDEYMTSFLGERKSLNRDYLFVMGMYPLLDIIDIQIFTIYNLNDNSMVINPEVVYRVFQDFEVTFTGSIFDGSDKSEFGYQDCACRLRFRAYF